MGGDRGYYKGIGRVPSPGGNTDHRDDGNKWGGWGVVITPGGGGNGSCRTSSHWRVHQERTGKHIGKGGLPPNLLDMCRGRADARDDTYGDMVVPGSGK